MVCILGKSRWAVSEKICDTLPQLTNKDKYLLFFENKGTNKNTFEIRFSSSPLAVVMFSVVSLVQKIYFQHVQSNIMCVCLYVSNRGLLKFFMAAPETQTFTESQDLLKT